MAKDTTRRRKKNYGYQMCSHQDHQTVDGEGQEAGGDKEREEDGVHLVRDVQAFGNHFVLICV